MTVGIWSRVFSKRMHFHAFIKEMSYMCNLVYMVVCLAYGNGNFSLPDWEVIAP